MASVGLPGTNGFVGEFMVITGTFSSSRLGSFNGVQATGAAFGVILGALYMLTAVQRMFFGPITRVENRNLKDVNSRELLALAPLAIMVFVIGLFPNIFLVQIKDACARVSSDLNSRIENVNRPPRYYEGPTTLVARKPEATKLPAPSSANAAGAAATSALSPTK
jgi:NADH-quinone oxidoreductase subunit M